MKRKFQSAMALGIALVGTVGLLAMSSPEALATTASPWHAPVRVSAGTNVQVPRVLSDSPGHFVAVWRDTAAYVSVSNDGGWTWTPATKLSATGVDVNGVRAAGDGNGNLAVTWWSEVNGVNAVQASFSSDAGLTWSERRIISDDRGIAQAPTVVSASPGSFTFAFSQYVSIYDRQIIVSRVTDDLGQTWSSFGEMSDTNVDANVPEMVVRPDGTITAVWTVLVNGDWLVHGSESTDGGWTWVGDYPVSDAGGSGWYPKLATSPSSVVSASWYRSSTGTYTAQSAPRSWMGATWYPISDLSNMVGGMATGVSIASDGTGRFATVWQFLSGSRSDIQFASGPDGAVWPDSGTITANDSGSSIGATIASLADGFVVAWNASDGASVVRASISHDGGATWDGSVDVSDPTRDASAPNVATDANGIAVVVWSVSDGNSWGIDAATTAPEPPPSLPDTGVDGTILTTGAVAFLSVVAGVLVILRVPRRARAS